MDFQIALLLGQDGLTNGAIYALLALALVLVFAITRVIFIPQGEFVAYGALTLAALQTGVLPASLWLLAALAVAGACADGVVALRHGLARRLPRILVRYLALPLALWLVIRSVDTASLSLSLQIVLALLVVVPLGPLIYRLAYEPVAEATVLTLLIVSIAVHVVLIGLGLIFFGAEGTRTPAFSEGAFEFAGIAVQYQTVWIVAVSALLIVALYFFFDRTLYGKALRATALNRNGARLMGIPTALAGRLSFGLAALIGAFSGILISPVTTLYYDSGFLIGLKGFVGAIIGGLASYPLAAAGALLVGFLEAYSSFWASAFKEVIVFTLIIPVLLWRSLTAHHTGDEE